MSLLQLIFVLIPIAVLDSINPSAIILTVLMLSKDTKIKNILSYILGIFISYLAIGAGALLLYRFFGAGYKLDFSFAYEYINSPPLWMIVLQFIAGMAILANTLYRRKYPKTKAEQPKTKSLTQTSLLSYFALGVGITGVEATTALPYFGAISTMFLANKGLFVNLILVFFYCVIFVLPPLVLIGIRLIYKDHFDTILAKLKQLSARYIPKIGFYGNLLLAAYLIIDSIQLFLK